MPTIFVEVQFIEMKLRSFWKPQMRWVLYEVNKIVGRQRSVFHLNRIGGTAELVELHFLSLGTPQTLQLGVSPCCPSA
jgi:hypothetical protein